MKLRALTYRVPIRLSATPYKLGIMSDLHLGREDTDEKLIVSELKQHDGTIINGDVLNLIGPQDRKRFTAQSVRFGSIDAWTNGEIDHALEVLRPYKDKIIGIGTGNHESAYLKYHGVDVTSILCRELGCLHLWYAGFIRLEFSQNGNPDRISQALQIYYNHGQGGGADRSRGILDFDYYYTTYEADLFLLGHAHKRVIDQNRYRVRLSSGKVPNILESPKVGIRTGCYRKLLTPAQGDYYEGDYGTERFKTPESRGGAIVELTRDGDSPIISTRGYLL